MACERFPFNKHTIYIHIPCTVAFPQHFTHTFTSFSVWEYFFSGILLRDWILLCTPLLRWLIEPYRALIPWIVNTHCNVDKQIERINLPLWGKISTWAFLCRFPQKTHLLAMLTFTYILKCSLHWKSSMAQELLNFWNPFLPSKTFEQFYIRELQLNISGASLSRHEQINITGSVRGRKPVTDSEAQSHCNCIFFGTNQSNYWAK